MVVVNHRTPHWRFELSDGDTIRQVIIRSGFIVDGIGFVLEHPDGTTSTKSFLGHGGKLSRILLQPDEYITRISGEHGVYEYTNRRHITLMRIHTNLRPVGYGPFGRAKCTRNIRRFSTPMSDCAIGGVFGASGDFLDCIGVISRKDHVDSQSSKLCDEDEKFNGRSSPEKHKFNAEGEDRISDLPDDIIQKFLSLLKMKEAAQTSILSKRWRYMWAHGSNLEFDPALVDPERCVFTLCSEMYKSKYINWVNQVVGLHRGEYIDKFRVKITLDDPSYVDKWIRFAISKRVKELDLSLYFSAPHPLGFDILKHASCETGMRFLTSLRLIDIQVTGDFLELLLSHSHNLEKVYVHGSHQLSSLKVLSRSLKNLTLNHCASLEQLEIQAVNLVYFQYIDESPCLEPNISFKSVPALVEVALGGQCCHFSIPIFRQISCLSKQLTELSLDLEEVTVLYDDFTVELLPSFSNVMQLEIRIQTEVAGLLFLTSLIDACPTLRDFKLQIRWLYDKFDFLPEDISLLTVDPYSELKSEPDHVNVMQDDREGFKTYTHLRTMEVDGFVGCQTDVELILHIVYSAPALERIVCDPRSWPASEAFELYTSDELETARIRAAKLARVVPPTVNVVVA